MIELIIAISLAGMATVLGAAVLKAGIDFHQRARLHLREQEDFRAALKILRYEWQGRVGNHVFSGQPFLVEFSARRFAEKVMGAQRIRYTCEPADPVEDQGYRLRRTYLAQTASLQALKEAAKLADPKGTAAAPPAGGQPKPANPAPPAGTTGKAPLQEEWLAVADEVMLDKLATCSFSYLETQDLDKRKTSRWIASWTKPADAPRLLRLNLSLARGAVPPLVFVAD